MNQNTKLFESKVAKHIAIKVAMYEPSYDNARFFPFLGSFLVEILAMGHGDEDDDGWEISGSSKQAKMKELQLKRQKKANDLQLKREQEAKEIEQKKKKMDEMMSGQGYFNKWEVLNDDVEDSEEAKREKRRLQKSKQKKQEDGDGTTFVYQSAFIRDEEKKKNQKKHQQQMNSQYHQLAHQEQKEKEKRDLELYPRTIELAKEKFNYANYYELMGNVEKKYPKVVDIQIKYIAECLEEFFGHVTMDSNNLVSVLSDTEFPLKHLSTRFVDETIRFLKQKPADNVASAVLFLINTLLSILKGEKGAIKSSGVGLLIFLQVVFKCNALVPLYLIEHFKTVFAANNLQHVKPTIASLYIWLIMQSIETNPNVALSFWLSIFLPLLLTPGVKIPSTMNDLIQKFTTKLFEKEIKFSSHKEVDGNILASSLELFLWSIHKEYSTQENILNNLNQLLFDPKKLFPSKNVSQSYLSVLVGSTAVADTKQRDRIILSIIECLKIDKKCYEYIKVDSSKNVAQINNILLYISLKCDELKLNKVLDREQMYGLAKYCKEQYTAVLETPPKKRQLPRSVEVKDIEMCLISLKPVLKRFKPSGSSSSSSGHNSRGESKGRGFLFTFFIILLPLIAVLAFFIRSLLCNPEFHQYQEQLHLEKYLTQDHLTNIKQYVCKEREGKEY
ncbi:hypothetical protein DFA_04522 [Cavenderia fasciculata]|uniref:Transmembrane protein n=1 Tax=Cavenderia fasciculata TaxID=261658 RepID=F4PPU0_CACFS|nr:uncharacterized protein DFA_04522 [Cavenderia fasciculata]EGG22403.1 hypothetical protein DFA_04522 [Cavenderia fasciculata]|eukprot:XP_004360254.1 hypothetical protein DFA_04522 [Cavenderia fasciculata]